MNYHQIKSSNMCEIYLSGPFVGQEIAAKMSMLTDRIKKPEVLRPLPPNALSPAPSISMDGNPLKYVDTLKYLGSCINSTANLDDEILGCISRASPPFGRLHTRVWHERGLPTKTKLAAYKALVLPFLLCTQ